MKTITIILLIMFASSFALANEITGPEIVQKVSDLMNQQSVEALMKLTIMTTSGKERTFTYNSFSTYKGEKNVIIYTAPKRVKGQATLLLNNADDIWSYDPRTDRVRKLASHAKKLKMQGSDFTYEDFGGGDAFITDFDSKRLDDDDFEDYDCYKVELKDNGQGSTKYERLILWVIKDNFVPVVIDYYEKDDPEIVSKRLVQSDIKIIESVPTAFKATMHNKRDNSSTKMEIVEIKYNVKIDDSKFNQRSFYR